MEELFKITTHSLCVRIMGRGPDGAFVVQSTWMVGSKDDFESHWDWFMETEEGKKA